jgi:hypothetical protein
MTRPWQRLLAELGETRKLIDGIDRRMEKVEVVLMVREPSSTVAADAYEGLRKQVVTAVTERWAHLAQLARFDAALAYGADGAALQKMVDEWLDQARLVRVTDPRDPNAALLFQLVEDQGGPLEVLQPAYRDAITGRVVQQGQARRRPARPKRPARQDPEPVPTAYQDAEYQRAEYLNDDYLSAGDPEGGRP